MEKSMESWAVVQPDQQVFAQLAWLVWKTPEISVDRYHKQPAVFLKGFSCFKLHHFQPWIKIDKGAVSRIRLDMVGSTEQTSKLNTRWAVFQNPCEIPIKNVQLMNCFHIIPIKLASIFTTFHPLNPKSQDQLLTAGVRFTTFLPKKRRCNLNQSEVYDIPNFWYTGVCWSPLETRVFCSKKNVQQFQCHIYKYIQTLQKIL